MRLDIDLRFLGHAGTRIGEYRISRPTSGERPRDLMNRSFSTTLWKFFGAESPGSCLSQGAPCGTCLGDE
jgi:hypothetical protein